MKHFRPSRQPEEGSGVLAFFNMVDAAVPDYFAADEPIYVARAPGRLDVMGGFADYSGSVVLQWPLAEAAIAAVQPRDDDEVHAFSASPDGSRSSHARLLLDDFGLPDRPVDYAAVRDAFAGSPKDRWVTYVLGAVLVLARERGVRFERGLAVLLSSDVPEGRGVGSSAAVEVAAMGAIAAWLGIELSGRELALLCQKVENQIAGAPCGAMDQMTAACAEAERLLLLRCQPCEVEGHLSLPEDLEVVGIESGVRRDTAGRAYTSVRVATFAGYRILAALRGLQVQPDGEVCAIDDPQWRGYLANCTPGEFQDRWADHLPESISGQELLQRFGPLSDPVTRVDPGRVYAVRACTRHPVEENARVERFRDLLAVQPLAAVADELGDLMFASHASYSACGLGNDVTDWIVEQVRQGRDKGNGLYGARITGGGGGGTVAILGRRGKVWLESLRIKKGLLERTGHKAQVFRWSSPGAMAFGTLRLDPRAGGPAG